MSKKLWLAGCVIALLCGSIESQAAKVQASTSEQQNKTVTGVVSDKMGPVQAAYVTIKRTELSLMLTESLPSLV